MNISQVATTYRQSLEWGVTLFGSDPQKRTPQDYEICIQGFKRVLAEAHLHYDASFAQAHKILKQQLNRLDALSWLSNPQYTSFEPAYHHLETHHSAMVEGLRHLRFIPRFSGSSFDRLQALWAGALGMPFQELPLLDLSEDGSIDFSPENYFHILKWDVRPNSNTDLYFTREPDNHVYKKYRPLPTRLVVGSAGQGAGCELKMLATPSITAAEDFGLTQDRGFVIVMKRATGTLHTLSENFLTLDLSEQIDIISELLSLFQIFQDMGYIHCDLKPENILFFENNPAGKRFKITDYSFMFDASEAQRIESHHHCRGTPRFMPQSLWENIKKKDFPVKWTQGLETEAMGYCLAYLFLPPRDKNIAMGPSGLEDFRKKLQKVAFLKTNHIPAVFHPIFRFLFPSPSSELSSETDSPSPRLIGAALDIFTTSLLEKSILTSTQGKASSDNSGPSPASATT